MREWTVALEARTDIRRFWRSDWAKRYIHGMWAQVQRREPERAVDEDVHLKLGRLMSEVSEPIYVTPEMMTLAEAAAESFQPEPLYESDLLVPTGMLYLPRPITIPAVGVDEPLDADTGLEMSLRVFNWATGGAAEDGTPIVNFMAYHAKGDHDTVSRDETDMNVPFPYTPELTFNFPYGAVVWQVEYLGNPEGIMRFRRFIQVLWRLIAQEIVTKERHHADKPARRRAEREDFTSNDILVVMLRRAVHREPEEEVDVEWTHRWMVSGHWRNQWYPSLQDHRQKWISPYIKGPEDKPFVPRPGRVFDLAR